MPEVLRADVAEGAARALRTPRAVLDPATSAEVEQAVAAGRAEAFEEGRRAGRLEVSDEVARVVEAVEAAGAAVRSELRDQRGEAVRASLALAEQVATAVLDATPPADATALLARVEEAVALLDDDEIVVALHPVDHAVLEDTPFTDRRLRLREDPTMPAGEARLEGPFGGVELTRRALLSAAFGLLGAGAT